MATQERIDDILPYDYCPLVQGFSNFFFCGYI